MYEEYEEEVVKCDWCHDDIERKETRCWVTGSRLCLKCYKEAEDKWNKFLENSNESRGPLVNTGW